MHIHSFTVGPFAENTYLLRTGSDALLIDPGFHEEAEFAAFQKKLEASSARLAGVVLTHAHVDHLLGLHRVLDGNPVPVYLSEKDRYLWENFAGQAQMFGFQVRAFDFDPEPLPARSGWTIGSFTFDTLYTPGHAPDHIALYHTGDQVLLAGDTLFREGVGRTDLYKGDMQLLKTSIRQQLYTLPDETTVYPGHGPATTIGHEKASNPFVRTGGG